MIFVSPFAIFVYVILAFSLVITIIVRLKKERFIADILRASPNRRAQTIKVYRQLIKTQKLLICIMPIAIAIMVSLYFTILAIDIFLLMSVLLTIIIVHSIEDIRFRRSVIVRLETVENTTVQQVTAIHDSQEVVAARVRKVKIILFLFIIVFIVGPLIALYFTLDMPLWLFAVITAFALLAALAGFTLGYKRQKKNLHS